MTRTERQGDAAPDGDGALLPAFVDAHVHLGLVDPLALCAGGIARVVDLGWDPAVARRWPSADVVTAGGLLTAVGGYPRRAGWAPRAAAVQVADRSAADDAVGRMAAAGAGVVKVALNADVGPVFDDGTLAAVVAAAHGRGLPVAVHAQGVGQVVRADDAGVDVFAHTPWSERLDDALVERLARRTTWISTLDIHGHGHGGPAADVARDNLARFHAAGGDVRYGTDQGNGPLPVGVDERELLALAAAGLDERQLVAALTTGTRARWEPFPEPSRSATRLVGPRPDDPTDVGAVAAWLASAQVVAAEQPEQPDRPDRPDRPDHLESRSRP